MPMLPTVDRTFGRGEHHVANEMAVPPGYARRIHNFNIDDSGLLVTRGKFGPMGQGGHSAFVMPDKLNAYFFDGGLMYKLNWQGFTLPVFGTSGQFSLQGSGRVWYVFVNETLYFSNGTSNGKIGPDGVASVWGKDGEIWSVGTQQDSELLPTVVDPFPASLYLTQFGGRIYGAADTTLFQTQPLNLDSYDPRYDFTTMSAKITAVGAVDGGLYVGTTDGVYFLKPEKDGQMEKVSSVPAIAGSQVYVPYAQLGIEEIEKVKLDDAFCWLTREGLCAGLPGGRVEALTAGAIKLEAGIVPVSNLVESDGSYQIVSVLNYPASSANRGVIDTVSVAF